MKQLILLLAAVFILSCHSTQTVVFPSYTLTNELLDTMVVRGDRISQSVQKPSGPYRSTAKRKHDLIHTALDLQLDWKEQSVLGSADLRIKPYFYPTGNLELDAVNFDIHKVSLINIGEAKTLKYHYDSKKINIELDKTYLRTDTFTIRIDYTAHPELDAREQSFAIGSDQGLFFIDPSGTHPGKPTQVWTQGETEYNSRWFPTIDKPNERCTQELSITVDDFFKTLSNGLLVSQDFHSNGTRTDHWKQDLPHAPYLFALIVGDYAVVKDNWNGLELSYYVYPDYKDYALEIFNHTPEMLQFFSDLTGVPYPWAKYSQVIVSDFVSGAMENTTSVVFAEGFQKNKEDLVDFPNDMIVAHEMFHHWFGNLVTCEGWSNLTLNEGFANYAEYLWSEYKYGKNKASLYHYSELKQYLVSAKNHTHPLIDFEYVNKDAMFDAHSYNKGGVILHMLRNYLGDDAFFEGVREYLKSKAFDSAEAHDLRLAFEKVTGEDLNWFFNQWFYDKGHPVLNADYGFIDSTKTLHLDIEQVQDSLMHRSVFQFPLEYQIIYPDGSSQFETVWINESRLIHKQILEKTPKLVLFNPGNVLLCELLIDYTPEEWAFLYDHSGQVITQLEAIREIKYDPAYADLMIRVLDHELGQIRILGLQYLSNPYDEALISRIKTMAGSDPHPLVRSRALRMLERSALLDETLVLSRIYRDSSASVLSLALDWLNDTNHPDAEKYASTYLNNYSRSIETSVASILSESGKSKYLNYFESRIFNGTVFMNSYMLRAYSKLLQSLPGEVIVNRSSWLAKKVRSMDIPQYEKNYYLQVLAQQIDALNERKSGFAGGSRMISEIDQNLASLRKLLKK